MNTGEHGLQGAGEQERAYAVASQTMSVPRSMHKMVTVPRGRGMLAMMKIRKGVISGMLLVKV